MLYCKQKKALEKFVESECTSSNYTIQIDLPPYLYDASKLQWFAQKVAEIYAKWNGVDCLNQLDTKYRK